MRYLFLIILKIYINGKLVTKNFGNDSSERYVDADKIVFKTKTKYTE